jgi:hypothetical protein
LFLVSQFRETLILCLQVTEVKDIEGKEAEITFEGGCDFEPVEEQLDDLGVLEDLG